MHVNLVRAVREAARLSKPELARMIGKEASTIGAWELEPGSADAKRLSEIAKEYGLQKVAHDLLELAGETRGRTASDVDLTDLSSDEEQLAQWIVGAYRQPQNDLEKVAVQLGWAIKNMAESSAAMALPPELAGLSSVDVQVLTEFIKSPNALMIAAAVAGGGNPPSAFAKPEAPENRGEDMAKRKTS